MSVRGLFALCLIVLAHCASGQISLDVANSHDVEIRAEADGVYSITTTGKDPWVVTNPLPKSTDVVTNPVLAFEYFCAQGVDDLTVYFGPPWQEGATASGGAMARAETWQPFAVDLRKNKLAKDGFTKLRLDAGAQKGVTLQIRNLAMRAPTPEELRSAGERRAASEAKQQLAGKFREYLDTSFPGDVERVSVGRDTVKVEGNAPPGCALVDIGLHERPWAMEKFTPLKGVPEGQFSVELPREGNGADRIFSRWAIVRDDRLQSSAKSATDVRSALRREPPEPMKPRSKKGISGVDNDQNLTELLQLGVGNISVNFVISSLLLPEVARQGTAFPFEGETFHIDERACDDWDRIVKWGTDHGIVVTGVLLVRLPENKKTAERLAWPGGGAPGLYVMPNLATAEGSRTYRALLAFVAERYSRTDRKFGSIARWVMHNEIDQSWVWTNMGEQPMELVMDAYVRSMRAMDMTLKQYDPAAKVFISLTHFWTAPAEPDFRQYRPKEMLELLAKIDTAEGDFDWGVAYHPYPQNLLDPTTWDDADATFDFDTKYITPKNIEVLDAFLRQPKFLYQGKTPRSVILSEQGFHTADYREKSQREQAAAFVYTWHKIRPIESIESFLNHRWIDHPEEGGLKLGLRTLPEEGKPHGDKKLSWEVYRALDTPDEEAATGFAKDIIGVDDFSEIPHPALK